MREELKKIHLPTLLILVALVAVTIAASGVAWWLNERVVLLEGDVPMMPRSEVTKAEKQIRPAAEIFNYSCETKKNAGQTENFYRSTLGNQGWRLVDVAKNSLLFEREGSSIRLVLHPQRFKTIFTMNVRQPVAEK